MTLGEFAPSKESLCLSWRRNIYKRGGISETMLEFCLVPKQQESYCHTDDGWPRLCLHMTNVWYIFAFLRFSTLLLKLNSEFQDFSCVFQISRLAFSHDYTKPIHCKSFPGPGVSFIPNISVTVLQSHHRHHSRKWMSWTKGTPSRPKVDLFKI